MLNTILINAITLIFMYSTIFLLLIFSFYLLYNLSKRVKVVAQHSYLKYLKKHRLFSKIVSLVLMGIACVLLVIQLGFGSGIFGFIVVLMSVGCLVVVLAPFRYLRIIHLLAVYLMFCAIETFIF